VEEDKVKDGTGRMEGIYPRATYRTEHGALRGIVKEIVH